MEKGKRKEWIKTFAIIFLSVLLVLTFFSNTIQNYSLPEVAAQYTSSGSITNKVRGSGVVESSDPYSVVFKQSRKVDSVSVHVGDEVEKGDVLYVLEDGESEELKAAQKTLDELQAAYDKALITGQVSTQVSGAVANGNTPSVAEMQTKIQGLKSQIEALEAATKNYETQRVIWANGTGTELAERGKLEEAKKNASAWDEQDKMNAVELTKAQTDLANAKTAFYDKFKTDYYAGVNKTPYNDVSGNGAISEDDYKKYVKAITDAEENLKAKEDAKENSNYQKVYADYAVTSAQKVIDERLDYIDYQIKLNETSISAAKEQLQEYVEKVSTQIDLSSQIKAIEEQKKVVEDLKDTEGASEITAPVSGTILSLAKVAGEDIAKGDTVATIQIAGKGFTLKMDVTNEQASLINVGDEAEVSNSYWYSDVQARIISIRPNVNNPSKGKTVTFELEGDVSNGQSLTLTVGKRTANYDIIVPNSAIKEDNNGKFVYKVNVKSTPLGNRYILERVDVKVLATDDTQSAISGALEGGWGEYIVTTSSKPLEDKMQVRLKD